MKTFSQSREITEARLSVIDGGQTILSCRWFLSFLERATRHLAHCVVGISSIVSGVLLFFSSPLPGGKNNRGDIVVGTVPFASLRASFLHGQRALTYASVSCDEHAA